MLNPTNRDLSSDNRIFLHDQGSYSPLSSSDRLKQALGDRDMAWLSRKTGIAPSTLSDIGKGKLPRTDRAIRIARALSVGVEWLFGGDPTPAHATTMSNTASTLIVPAYAFELIRSKDARENAAEQMYVPRTWLKSRFAETARLWITELRSDYPEYGMSEGDPLLCSDISEDGFPADNWLCLFDGPGGAFLSRYRTRPGGFSTPLSEAYISGEQLKNGNVSAIARVHAKLFASL